MKKIIMIAMMAIAAITMTGCYEQIPAGTKGKILGPSGFQPEIYPPSRIWLSNNIWNMVPERMYFVQTTTKKYAQPIDILLNDKLNLEADIIFRGRISGNEDTINSIFNDLPMDDNIVTTDEVYNIYGKMVVLNTAREVISQYNVDEVNRNYKRITTELYQALKPKLEGLPIEISDVTIGNIQYPDIVTKAIGEAKERRMAIEKEEANVQIALKKAEGREAVANAEYRIKMIEAKRIADFNKKIASGITDDLLKLRQLEIAEQQVAVQKVLAENLKGNNNAVYMPIDMMQNPNYQLGHYMKTAK